MFLYEGFFNSHFSKFVAGNFGSKKGGRKRKFFMFFFFGGEKRREGGNVYSVSLFAGSKQASERAITFICTHSSCSFMHAGKNKGGGESEQTKWHNKRERGNIRTNFYRPRTKAVEPDRFFFS